MHGINAELHGHPGKEYWKSRLHPQGEEPGRFTKKLTHKKERRETKQLLHILKQEIDILGGSNLEYQFANNEDAWTTRLDSC